jgi:3',5'-cyclic-AMP phosphodiesterase
MRLTLMSKRCCLWLSSVVLGASLIVSCRTAPSPREAGTPTRIALISDLHVMVATTNAKERLYPLRLAKTIEAVNAARVDFVIAAGDLTEHGTEAEFAEFKRRVRGLAAPLLYIPGNHDVGNKLLAGGKKEATNFGRTRRYEMTLGRSYFAREIAGVRVLGVNSCLFGSRLPRERQMWNLLERELAAPSKRPTLLVQHHPPFMKSFEEPGGDYFNMEPYPRARLLGLARQGGVQAILSGHLHRGLTNVFQGVVLLTTPPVSFGLQNNKPLEGWMLLTVAGTNLTWDYHPLPKVALPQTTSTTQKREDLK